MTYSGTIFVLSIHTLLRLIICERDVIFQMQLISAFFYRQCCTIVVSHFLFSNQQIKIKPYSIIFC